MLFKGVTTDQLTFLMLTGLSDTKTEAKRKSEKGCDILPCYHPNKAWPIGYTENNKVQYKITGYNVDYITRKFGSDIWICCNGDIIKKIDEDIVSEYITVPCGQCIGCRLDYSRQWANRCMLELQYHDSAYFVTLTYDDFHVPRSLYGDEETGEALPSLTLRKRDFQLFMKRLRKSTGQSIRFYACGEYGDGTYRPHYHAILYGLKLDDLKPYKKNFLGQQLYNSDVLTRAWSVYDTDVSLENKVLNPLGYAVIGEVTWESCAYVARYILKKQKGESKTVYDRFNIEPPFVLMSRKPGIARQFYDDHKEKIYEYDQINIKTSKGGRQMKPPKYFDKLFDVDNPFESAEIKKIRRKVMDDVTAAKLSLTELCYSDMLMVEEAGKQSKIKSLRRVL